MKNKRNNPLIVVILILVIAIITILATIGVWKWNSPMIGKPEALRIPNPEGLVTSSETPQNLTTVKPRNVCETPECVTLAHELLNWRDKTVNPCDNFYKSSCGNYIEHTLADGTRNVKKGKVIKRLIREFLVKNHTTTSKSEQTMKQVYSKCAELKNEQHYHLEHNKTMRELLQDIKFLGPWPMMEPHWNPSNFSLNSMLLNMAKLGHYDFGLFKLTAKQNWQMRLEADYEKQEHTAEHKVFELISALFYANNIPMNETSIRKELKIVHNFYEELKFNTTGFNKLHEIAQSIQFEPILKQLLDQKTGDWKTLKPKIENADKVFKAFGGHHKITNATLKRVLANYVVLRFIHNSYSSISYSQKSATDRACDDIVIHNLPRATLRAFVQNHFDRENLKIVSEMLENTRRTFLDIILNATWLSAEGKERAGGKISMMKKLIGYPEEYDQKGALDLTFATLHTKESDSFYMTMKKIRRYRSEILMDFIAFNRTLDPTYELFNVNAFYSSGQNRMSIMVPFIDEPNMEASYPAYAKYAVTGDILGHEMGHSLDPQGINWNEYGEYEKWLPDGDKKKYDEKVQCLRDQYESYDDPDFGKHLESARVINEIVADRYGIDAALRTYRSLNLKDEQKIIGFENEPPEKMMFRILALDFCAPRSTKSLKTVLDSYTHPTNSFRVNGVFSNLKSFSDAFECPLGSPMNPKKKCTLLVD